MEENNITNYNKQSQVDVQTRRTVKSSSRRHLFRQWLVSTGVSLSIMELGLIIGFTAVLIPQLRDDTYMGMDKNAESWIASIQGFSFMLAAFVSPCVIDQYGRRKANFIGAIIVAIGWFFLIVSGNLTMIIIARILQGLALGISSLSGAVLVAEYTSPKYRGAFITLTTITMLSGSLIVHALGSFLLWHQVAIFCLCVAILDGVLVFLSPESPVFLATQGRFDECKKVFHWLRDLDEDEELDAMIKVQILRRAAMNEPQKTILNKFTVKIKSALITIKKADFYKPLIVMMHFNIISVWCGAVMMDAYGFDVFQKLVGNDINIIMLMLIMDIIKIISAIIGIVIHTTFRRRSMLMFFGPLNIVSYILLIVYLYAKDNHIHIFNNPFIAAVLIYALVFSVAAGLMPLVNIIAGEIFPLKYKAVCTLITTLFAMGNLTVKLNTMLSLFSSIGLSGSFVLYGALVLYSVIILLLILPETKDKTLQNIEEKSWKKIRRETDVMSPLDNQLLDLLESNSNKLQMSAHHQNDKENYD